MSKSFQRKVIAHLENSDVNSLVIKKCLKNIISNPKKIKSLLERTRLHYNKNDCLNILSKKLNV